MSVRRATEADLETLVALWDDFAAVAAPPSWVEGAREGSAEGIADSIREGLAYVAEQDGRALGFAAAVARGSQAVELTELYVHPDARRGGVARALLQAVAAEVAERGAGHVLVSTGARNEIARTVFERWGFRPQSIELYVSLEELEQRLGPKAHGRSFGSIHVQSDELGPVERAVRQFVPRLPGGSQGSVVVPPRNGWTSVYDELCDRDPAQLRRLARELSDRMGAVVLAMGVELGAVARFVLFERGRVMDEYLSVREYYGPLPPGDVVGLAANPTVVARLTGANRDAVRAAALHADAPEELPPPVEIVAGLAAVMGVAGADLDYAQARSQPGALLLPRG